MNDRTWRFIAAAGFALLLVLLLSCARREWRYSRVYEPVQPARQDRITECGLDVLEQDGFAPLQGRSVAVVTNQTGLNRHGEHILELIARQEGIRLQAIFAPEHGLTGRASAGERIDDAVDARTGVVIYSLYGATRKPTPEQLAGVELLLFDGQDAGARYYTKPSTLTLVMESCAEAGIPIWLLDRPNPVRGDIVDGPILDTAFASFVGMHPVVIRHGMTLGELAVMINEEGWLREGLHADLTVVPVRNWTRDMWWDQTGLAWVPTSPNIPTAETALAYLGTCLLEGTSVAEGRGTYAPFLTFGAPWIGDGLAGLLNGYGLLGVVFRDTLFTPRSIEGASGPKYQDQACRGARLEITDRDAFEPIHTGAVIIHAIRTTYPREFTWQNPGHIERLWGSDAFRRYIDEGRDIGAHPATYARDRERFQKQRRRYLIYDE